MVNSGSSALMLLVDAKFKKGDDSNANSYFSINYSSILKKGIIPKFIDVNLKNLQIDLDQLKKYN